MIENPMILFPLLILFLPLLSFIIVIFFGNKLPRQGDWVANNVKLERIERAKVILNYQGTWFSLPSLTTWN